MARSDSHRFRWLLISIALGLAGAGQSAVLAQEEPKKPAEAKEVGGLPAPLSGFSDEGVFHLYVNESRLATMSFKWRDDGTFEGKSTLSMGGQSVDSSLSITPGKDGLWVFFNEGER